MITIIEDKQAYNGTRLKEAKYHPAEDDTTGIESIENAMTHYNPTTQMLLSSKIVTHTPDAGLNPLVDAAAYLFSIMGKLKHTKKQRDLGKLKEELLKEIEAYRENAKTYSYKSELLDEYLPVTCYALCVTLDDIIASMPWGNEGRWDEHSLLVAFNQNGISRESFFLILEHLIRDPAQYIDVMEFMYICLSLGFKGHYNSSTLDHDHLEQIINALYKRIRAFRGDFSKTLSPFLIKSRTLHPAPPKKMPTWLVVLLACNVIVVLFAGAKYFLDISSNKVYQNLNRTEKATAYELHNAARQ